VAAAVAGVQKQATAAVVLQRVVEQVVVAAVEQLCLPGILVLEEMKC
jgi:hypothetical protein